MKCFECSRRPAPHLHRVVPGGHRTVPLCDDCWELVRRDSRSETWPQGKATRADRARRGHYVGGGGIRKYGYQLADVDGRRDWVPVFGEQLVIQRIVDMRAAGLTLRAVAEQLNDEGVPTVVSGRWHATTVRTLLLREGVVTRR